MAKAANRRTEQKYVWDCLYGRLQFGGPDAFIWNLMHAVDVQRLREIRLCNTKSLRLTGGADTTRFEHAIGTCHLARTCLDAWPFLMPLTEEERRTFLAAALVHDVLSGPFGHSWEYVEGRDGFTHEGPLEQITKGAQRIGDYEYFGATTEPLFAGMLRDLGPRLEAEGIRPASVGKLMRGEGRLGPLLNSAMDIDNIDNVYRLAYHMGLAHSGDVPLELAGNLYVGSAGVILRREALPLARCWHRLRHVLYALLLLNPEEFAAKCMLSDAIELAKASGQSRLSWTLTDAGLIEELRKHEAVRVAYWKPTSLLEGGKPAKPLSPESLRSVVGPTCPENVALAGPLCDRLGRACVIEVDGRRCLRTSNPLEMYSESTRAYDVKHIVTRLIMGDLYGCIALLETQDIEAGRGLLNRRLRCAVEDVLTARLRALPGRPLGADVLAGVHVIDDCNKTEREVRLRDEQNHEILVGPRSDRFLIGVFARNTDLGMRALEQRDAQALRLAQEAIVQALLDVAGCASRPLELYDEAEQV